MAELIEIYIIPKQKLRGIIHVSGYSISKYELLKLISNIYNKDIEIKLDKSVSINRSLDSSKFNKLTGYKPKSWPVLIKSMYEFNQLDMNIENKKFLITEERVLWKTVCQFLLKKKLMKSGYLVEMKISSIK